ncbi:hypothetical protein LVISKB_1098 [Levilactobacillus brevis KB290]|uniref:Uncharacterized protein n=1 Tax=Levilactobacillus brevis KB290 TaxID=1001583 RepID=M5AD38_LEVBR|nr:hypothetical protein LVISKB_1098 [Levilactobacillus brevis KB290]
MAVSFTEHVGSLVAISSGWGTYLRDQIGITVNLVPLFGLDA